MAALLLAGCSALKLSYNNADTLLYWRLDSYVDLSREQAPRVRESLRQYQRWHRQTQLPLYADLLQRIRPQLAGPVSTEQACAWFEQIRDLLLPSLDLTPDAGLAPLFWLVGDLSDEQLQHIARKQASTDADWKDKWLDVTPERREDERFDQALSRSELLYGRLGEAQQAALRESLAAEPFDPQRSLAERQRRQQDLRQLLRRVRDEKLGPEPARALLKAYLDRAQQAPDPVTRRYQQAQIHEGCAGFARLHQAATPAQRARAMQTLKNYEDDFRLLAGQP
ncbi:MAG: DUF6279 family lipoprotein [Burkholderiaceae bacterium]